MVFKRSKIKSIQANGTWETRDGKTMYQSEVELEDGATGEVNATTPDRWHVGDEVQYEEKDGKYGKKLKLSKAMNGFSFGDNSEPNSTSTSNSVTRFEDRDAKRQSLIMNQWAIRLAIETELGVAPPDKFELRNAIAIAKLLKKYALDLENVDVSLQAEEPIENPF
tara:strand:+ start:1658 stop:2155 length:498 start_codon:yes stop_codon:yes gene_type:complete